ncbi:hypothetical protein ACIQNG_26140 [Streptomyces sp. NPDC091377]|uniref:hypothetical protein n=1 Tax=Streptomyces sp. NPDC091377 TaxID=3365995 RepID=UPI0037F83169
MSVGGYPQDVMENAFDYGHGPHVHRIHVEQVEDKMLGPVHDVRLLLRSSVIGRLPPLPMHVTHYGLGLFRTEVDLPALRVSVLIWICAVPTAGARMTLRTAITTTIGNHDSPVRRAAAHLVSLAAMPLFFMALSQDAGIWNHHRLVSPPRLAQGDGPIGPFRRWAEQFYPTQPETAPVEDRS